MKFLVLLFFFLNYILPSHSGGEGGGPPVPTGVYVTYYDYVQHKIKPMDDYLNYRDSIGTSFVVFQKSGKKFQFDCSKIWGFQYKYKLFRCDTGGRPPARVMSAGKIIYYENGLAHLYMLKYDTEEGHYSSGAYCYLSNNLIGTMVPMPEKQSNLLYKDVVKFKNRNKQYKELFKCIETDYSTLKIAGCVKNFERGM